LLPMMPPELIRLILSLDGSHLPVFGSHALTLHDVWSLFLLPEHVVVYSSQWTLPAKHDKGISIFSLRDKNKRTRTLSTCASLRGFHVPFADNSHFLLACRHWSELVAFQGEDGAFCLQHREEEFHFRMCSSDRHFLVATGDRDKDLFMMELGDDRQWKDLVEWDVPLPWPSESYCWIRPGSQALVLEPTTTDTVIAYLHIFERRRKTGSLAMPCFMEDSCELTALSHDTFLCVAHKGLIVVNGDLLILWSLEFSVSRELCFCFRCSPSLFVVQSDDAQLWVDLDEHRVIKETGLDCGSWMSIPMHAHCDATSTHLSIFRDKLRVEVIA
jgi:hypothetical protein